MRGGGDFRPLWLDRGGGFQLLHQGAAELVEGGNGDVAVAFELVVEGAEFERGIAETAELLDEFFAGKRVFRGGFKQEGGGGG